MNRDDGAAERRTPMIGPYRVLRMLGEGAIGRVFLAEQDQPQRQVAIKLFKFGNGSDEDRLRFRREIELLAALDHPGIARLYASGQVGSGLSGMPYLVMEYVRGEALLAYAQSHQLTPRERVQLLVPLARSLHYAHTRGVLHRNLKPGSILVDEFRQSKVLDLGLTQTFGDDDLGRIKHLGSGASAVLYLSPEQLAGQPADPRCDVYALGLIAYELLSESPARAIPVGASVETAVEALRNAEQPSLVSQLPEAEGDLDTVVMKALAPDRDARYGSAAEFASELERYLAGHPIEARAPSAAYVLSLLARRHRRLVAAAAAAAALTIALLAVAFVFALHEHASRRADEQHVAILEARQQELLRKLAVPVPPPPPVDTIAVLDRLDDYARLLSDAGRYDEALAQFADLVPRARSALGPRHPQTLAYESHWGESLHRAGHDAQAREVIEATVAQAVDNPDVPATALSLLQQQLAALAQSPRDPAADTVPNAAPNVPAAPPAAAAPP